LFELILKSICPLITSFFKKVLKSTVSIEPEKLL
jgi:hypothetical protein